MRRVVHIEVEGCGCCPYCQYDPEGRGFDCTHPKTEDRQIISDQEHGKLVAEDGFDIGEYFPDWCSLPEVG